MSGGWADDSDADPVADLQVWSKMVSENTEYKPTTWFISSTQYADYLRYMKWREQMEMMLDGLPRRRFITAMVVRRRLYGSWWRRRKRMRLERWLYRVKLYRRARREGWYE